MGLASLPPFFIHMSTHREGASGQQSQLQDTSSRRKRGRMRRVRKGKGRRECKKGAKGERKREPEGRKEGLFLCILPRNR